MTQTPTRFDAPDLRRLRYFTGQGLGARDFQREQDYVRDKLKLRMRALLGFGVACGLHVEPVPAPPGCEPDQPDQPGEHGQHGEHGEHRPRLATVRLTAGLGVDCHGNEVLVRGGCEIDLWAALPLAERDELPRHPVPLWLGVSYRERAVEPTRVVFDDGGDGPDTQPGYTQETFALHVTTRRPTPDRRCDICESCGDGCDQGVLWLARIDDVRFHHPVEAGQIHQEIRRPFGRRVPTVITGINWIHGHTYTVQEAERLLGTHDEDGGLVVRFSDDVHTGSLRRGVVDVQVIEGGPGRNAGTYFMGGAFRGLPAEEFTREFRFKQLTRESPQDRDRVLITVRTAFILDRCCRPVDGTHVGGLVPLIHQHHDHDGHDHDGHDHDGHDRDVEDGADVRDSDEIEPPDRRRPPDDHGHDHDHDHDDEPPRFCLTPPGGIGPWTSGTGAGGATFESWFFVKEGR